LVLEDADAVVGAGAVVCGQEKIYRQRLKIVASYYYLSSSIIYTILKK
jgi:hypothetical protein